MKTKITLFLFIAFFSTQAQIVTTLGTVTGAGSVNVPITVDNFSDVGSLSLTIFYDNTIALYNGTENIHPSLIGTFGFDAGGILAFSWLDMTLQGVTLPNGTVLFELSFTEVSTGTTDLAFSTDLGACEYSDAAANTMSATFNDGLLIFGVVNVLEEATSPIRIYNSSSYLEIQLQDTEPRQIYLVEITGKNVKELFNNRKHNTEEFPRGIYFVKVIDSKGNVLSKKFFL